MKRALLLCLPFAVMLACTSKREFDLAPLTVDHPASAQAQEAKLPVVAWALPASEGHAMAQDGAEPPEHASAPPPSGVSERAYMCPMHSEIRQAEPGRCPKCGMQLVKEEGAELGHDHQEDVEKAPGHEHGQKAEPDSESESAERVHGTQHEPAAAQEPESEPGAGHGHEPKAEPEQQAEHEHGTEEPDPQHEAQQGHAAEHAPEVAVETEQAARHEHAATTGHHHAGGGEQRHGIGRFIAWLGKFHPMVVHFPIALVFAAALAELLGLASAARFCVLTAAVTAIAAASLGWAHAWSGDFPPDLVDAVERHRWFGTTTAAWLTLTTLCSESARRRATRSWLRGFRLLLFGGTVLVAITGHLGSIVTHGPDYAAW